MKDVLTKLEYSTDYAGDEAAATFSEIPIGKIFADNASLFGEEPQYADLINGARRVAATTGSATYPYEYTPGDATLDALKTALDNGEPVWIRETIAPGHTILCGGETGCFGGVSLARSGYGGFAMQVVDVSAPGASLGDSFDATAAA